MNDSQLRYLLYESLQETLMINALEENVKFDCSGIGLSFDHVEFIGDNILYYRDGKQIYLSDKEVLDEIWCDF